MKLSTKRIMSLVLGVSLVLSFSICSRVAPAEEEVMVPFGEIQSSCYGEIDISKAEFALSEVGEECVNEDWLEENKPKEKSSTNTRVTKEEKADYRIELAIGSERDAAKFSWQGHLSQDEDNIIKVHVFNKAYLHESYIEGEKKTTVTFALSHRDPSRWGKAIQNLPKEKSKGPGFVEKAEVPVERKGEKWVGEVKAHLRRSVKHIQVWKKPDTLDEGWCGVHVKLKPEGELGKLVEGQPTLEEVVEVIDTPEELVKFMNFYFINKFHEGHTAYPPREFLRRKQGNCKDYAVFSGYVLKENGYKAKQLSYSRKTVGGGHIILLYWEGNKIYSIDKKGYIPSIFGPFSNVEAVLENEVERRRDIPPDEEITCYALAPPTKLAVEKPCLFTPPEEK